MMQYLGGGSSRALEDWGTGSMRGGGTEDGLLMESLNSLQKRTSRFVRWGVCTAV